jgi:hypothetical protein
MSRLVLAIVLAVCVAGCAAATFGRGGCKPSSNLNWDYFLLMQQYAIIGHFPQIRPESSAQEGE